MGMIVDYVCMNCFFIGTTADRGTRCCEKPDLMSVKGYHTVRKTAAKKGRYFEVNPEIQKYFSIALEESRYKAGDDDGGNQSEVSEVPDAGDDESGGAPAVTGGGEEPEAE